MALEHSQWIATLTWIIFICAILGLLVYKKNELSRVQENNMILLAKNRKLYQDLKAANEFPRKNEEEPPMQNCTEEYAILEAKVRHLLSIQSQIPLEPEHSNSPHLHCRPGWEEHASRCFHLSHYIKSWEDARYDCLLQGGDLAVVLDVEDQKFLTNLTFEFARRHPQDFHAAWVGLLGTRQGEAFVWANSNTTLHPGVTFWKDGGPNYVSSTWGSEDKMQGCVGIVPPVNIGVRDWLFNWDNIICGGKRHYVCEIDIDRPP